MKNLIDFIIENWKETGLSVLLLEIVMRLYPTKKDWSLFNKILRFLDLIIPNLERDEQTKKIKFRKNKIARILIFFVLCVGSGNYAKAQSPVNHFVKGLFSYNVTDTVFMQNTRTNLQNYSGNTGGLYFDQLRNKWRIWDGTQWTDLTGQGSATFNFDSLPFVTPEHYGAVGDGVTNDAVPIQSAVNSGKPVWFSEKTYYVSTTINIPSFSKIIGSGKKSVILTDNAINIFTITGINSTIDNLTFKGNRTATQTGISAIGTGAVPVAPFVTGTKINMCSFDSLYNGLYTLNSFNPTTYEGAFYVSNSTFSYNSNAGAELGLAGEYNIFTGNKFYGNNYGIYLIGGNQNITGGSMSFNTTAIRIIGGSNNGKHSITGITINHNTTYSVQANTVSNGFKFVGNNVYSSGQFYMQSCSDVLISDNTFSESVGTFSNLTCTNVNWSNNYFLFNTTFSITGTQPKFFNNTYSVAPPTTPQALNTLATKLNTTSNVTLPAISIGSIAGDPTTLANGDLWYNSTSGNLRARIGGNSVSLGANVPAGSNTEIQFNNSGVFGADPDLSFTGGNTLNTDILVITNTPVNQNTDTEVLVRNSVSGLINFKADLIDGSMTTNGIPIATDGNTVTTDTDLSFTGGNTLNTAELDISGLPAVSGVLFNTAGTVDNDGDFTFNPTGAALNINDGQLTVTNTGTSAVTTIRTADIRIDSDGDADFTTFSETAISPSSGASISFSSLQNIIAGTYTPTFSTAVNVSSSTSAVCNYTRIGNNANVSGVISITPTATGLVAFDIDLPIAASFTINSNAGGGGSIEDSVTGDFLPIFLTANAATELVRIRFEAITTNAQTVSFQFMYSGI